MARDINGTALENAPFETIFHEESSSSRFQQHLPVQVQSCWNGIAVLDPAPFYSPPHVRFRMARITENECSASECSLICNDYWEAGYGRIMMVPRVKLAYDRVRLSVSLLFDYQLMKMGDVRKCLILSILNVETLRPYEDMFGSADFQTTPRLIHRIGLGLDLTIGCLRQKNTNRSSLFLDQSMVSWFSLLIANE